MSNINTGKGFEFACLLAVKECLDGDQTIVIEENNSYKIAEQCYNSLPKTILEKMKNAARSGIIAVLKLEPLLKNNIPGYPLILSIQPDSAGVLGDVRDVLCLKKINHWEIGFSCKHNHKAVKHSRLSQTIDFGKEWFGYNCSLQYFSEIKPLFTKLKLLKEQGELWRNIKNKASVFYVPLLNAFITELRKLNESHDDVSKKLIQYLLGKNDFYKIMSIDSQKSTQIQAFNINGTLNNKATFDHAIPKISQIHLPSRIIDISFKPGSDNTILVVCDVGWQISMRIHNASSKVEASLKFDVQLIGIPPVIYSNMEPWSR